MCSCHSILECCVMFSEVKLSIRSFVLFINYWEMNNKQHSRMDDNFMSRTQEQKGFILENK